MAGGDVRNTRVVRQLVKRLLPRARIHFSERKGTRFSWNGKNTLSPSGGSFGSQLHDVCHLLIAAVADSKRNDGEKQLAHPEFGLGGDPYRSSYGDLQAIRGVDGTRQERDTTTLQFAIAQWLGLPMEPLYKEYNGGWVGESELAGVRERWPEALSNKIWSQVARSLRGNR